MLILDAHVVTFYLLNLNKPINTKECNQIIDSLTITFIKAQHIKLLKALTVENFQDVENFFLLLNRGQMTFTQEGTAQKVVAGDILFIPGGQPATITYGSNHPVTPDSNLNTKPGQYFQTMQTPDWEAPFDHFSYVTFDARIFNTANFFAYFGIPAFVITGTTPLHATLKNILAENNTETVGSSRMVAVYTVQLVVELVRYIIASNLFAGKLAAHIHDFNNPRIVSIFDYIQKNLHGDLSNRALATVAHIAEDYVGQYFKLHTGTNPQNYIEYQRMEQAVKLLRTTKKSIHDIGKAVGFRDTAYFCRRFKMKFGVSAGKMRSWEATMRIGALSPLR